MQFIPLRADGSKAPAVKGWADADYRCTKAEALAQSPWVGMRADNLVIIDCDSKEAADAWLADTATGEDLPVRQTTPRGAHFIYTAGPGAPSGPAVGVLPATDIRAGRGSYIVVEPSPGYTGHDGALAPFDPAWVPSFTPAAPPGDQGPSSPDPLAGWTTIPSGTRNNTLAAFAGAFRKQGMQPKEIGRLLLGLNKQYCDPPLDVDEIAVIARSIGRYEPDPDVDIIIVDEAGNEEHITRTRSENTKPANTIPWLRASTFGPPAPKTWLWQDIVPDNTMTLVSGREGIGKGLFCAYLATSVAKGVRPGSGEVIPKRPILWLSAEDHPQEDVWGRLRSAGWDPETDAEIYFMDMRHTLVLPEDILQVQDAIDEFNPGLIVMDPGRSFFGRRKEHSAPFSFNNEADIRPALQKLLMLCAANRTPTIFVGHWKKGEGDPRDMTSGTIAWKQIPRHALDFVESPRGESHAFWVGKTNIGQKGFVTEYDIEAVPEYQSAQFVLGDPSEHATLVDWMDAHKDADIEIDYTDAVVEYLDNYTDNGERPMMPTRDELKATGVPQHKLKVVIRALTQQGRIRTIPGKRSEWLG